MLRVKLIKWLIRILVPQYHLKHKPIRKEKEVKEDGQ